MNSGVGLRTMYICPCDRPDPDNSRWYLPDFVGSDYYCESGFVSNNEARIAWEDPLWDGAGCVTPGNTCCQRYQRQHRGQVVCRGIKVKWRCPYRSCGDMGVGIALTYSWYTTVLVSCCYFHSTAISTRIHTYVHQLVHFTLQTVVSGIHVQLTMDWMLTAYIRLN